MSTRKPVTTRQQKPAADRPAPITAGRVTALLHSKYEQDYYTTTEIGLGRARRSEQRADFLAMKASWATPAVVIAEVKVSRADFMQDDKWTGYLPYCTHFFFATAPGIVKRDEIPEQAGWFEVSAGGKQLIKRKNAPALRDHVDPKHEAELLKSVVMRHHYGRFQDPTMRREQRIREWEAFLETKDRARLVGTAVRREISLALINADAEIAKATRAAEAFQATEAFLKEIGFNRDQAANLQRRNMLRNKLRYAIQKHFGADVQKEQEEIARAVRQFNETMRQWGGSLQIAADQAARTFAKCLEEAAETDPTDAGEEIDL